MAHRQHALLLLARGDLFLELGVELIEAVARGALEGVGGHGSGRAVVTLLLALRGCGAARQRPDKPPGGAADARGMHKQP